MTPRDLEKLWEQHLAREFTTKDVEATLATMTDDAVVDHIPVHSGGRGKDALRAFSPSAGRNRAMVQPLPAGGAPMIVRPVATGPSN